MSNIIRLATNNQDAHLSNYNQISRLLSYSQSITINMVENLDQPYIPLYDSLNSDIYDSNNLRVRMSNNTYGLLLFKSVYTSTQIDSFVTEVLGV